MQTSKKGNDFIEWILDHHVFLKEEQGTTYLELPLVQAGLKNNFADFITLPDVAEQIKSAPINKATALRLVESAYNTIRKTS